MTVEPGEAEYRWAFLPYRQVPAWPGHPSEWDERDLKGT